MSLNILVFYGSVRTNRQGIKAAKFIINKLKERQHNAELIDPEYYDFPLLEKMYKSYKDDTAPVKMKELADKIKNADAFVIVSGEYNHSIPPALTNLMDHFLEEYFFRPSAIVSYSAGSFGGVRAAMQLRAFLGELGTVSIPSIFPVPKVKNAFDDDGNPLDDKYNKRVRKFLDELEWYANAIRNAKKNNPTPY